ncbi:MAG: UDP-N-acetylglucosamine 2-epimerase [Clostridia bacterium]|nr:UDP-N-acetylglucosamine 2-epimerase [Clostridia bacterium]
MKVLILYAKVGNGHLKASEAIRDKLVERFPDAEIFFEDGLESSGALTNKLIIKGYAGLVKHMPDMYGKLYATTDSQKRSMIEDAYKVINKYLTIRLKRMLRKISPDVIVSTHPFITRMCAYLKKKKKTNAKLLSLVTDYGIHNMWVNDEKNIDCICVATEEMKYDCMEEYGIDNSKVFVTGIPVSDKFLTEYDKKEMLKELDLKENLPVFLFFAGGGLGLGDSEKILTELLQSKKEFQIVVVSGKNEKQKARFEEIVEEYSRRVVILGYTNRVPELMNIATAVITKPGGLTSTECLVMKKPMVIINPIPGQEEQNASYFVNNGTALEIYESDKISHIVNIIVEKKERLKQMEDMCENLRHPNASDEIVNLVNKLYNEKI